MPRTNTVAFDMGREEDPARGFYKRAGDTRKAFLERGAAVLKYECEWREPGAPFADRRRVALQYYLADDTLEILDRSSAYSSGGLFGKLLQRTRMPRLPVETGKEVFLLAEVGDAASGLTLPPAAAVLTASAAIRGGYEYAEGGTTRAKFTSPITGRPLFEPAPAAPAGDEPAGVLGGAASIRGIPVLSSLARAPTFVTPADIVPGGIVTVFGRPLLVRSADPFAVAYMLHNFGVDLRPLFVAEATPAAAGAGARVPLPPHVGAVAVGSEEETRRNAGKLLPTFRRERDFDLFYQLGGKSLRFEAAMDAALCDPEDARRRFILAYYLEDNTVSVGELTGNTLGHGPSVVRFLNRGRYRNAAAAPDAAATAALGIPHADTPMTPAVAAAYDRVVGGSRDKMGYTECSGAQGYAGGIFGKAERVGAGATGVESVADMGVREAALHAMPTIARFFEATDFVEGARIQFAHAPGIVFVLGAGDSFTRQFLAARAAGTADDARDVYVPENSVPVPTLPLEGGGGGGEEEGAVAGSGGVAGDCLLLAKILAGVQESCREVVRQADRVGRGFAPEGVVRAALASYGAAPPACDADVLDRVMAAYEVAAGGSGDGGRPTTATVRPGGSGSLGDPLSGPFLRDYAAAEFAAVRMVAYPALFDGLKAATTKQLALQPRIDKLLSQLRSAVLSSRAHLRKVFRDLDATGVGAITQSEFRHLLRRHNLDVGISDAQLRALMSRFPPAPAAVEAALRQPAIDWRGFVEGLLEGRTLAESEMASFLSFVRGLKDGADDGVGTTRVVPQVKPTTNVVSSWTPRTADPTPYLAAMGSPMLSAAAAAAAPPPPRPATAPAAYAASSRGAAAVAAVAAASAAAAATSRCGTSSGAPSSRATSVSFADPVIATRPATSAGVMGTTASSVAPPRVPALPADKATFPSARAVMAATAPTLRTVDVLASLAGAPDGAALLASLRTTFAAKRFDLYRAMSLYDTTRRRVLNVPSFVSALTSAGLRWDRRQLDALRAALTAGAARSGLAATEHDVYVDYNVFFDTFAA